MRQVYEKVELIYFFMWFIVFFFTTPWSHFIQFSVSRVSNVRVMKGRKHIHIKKYFQGPLEVHSMGTHTHTHSNLNVIG